MKEKKDPQPWHCPKGPASYSTHRFVEISRKQVGKSVYDVRRRCKLCGKIDVAEVDYMILSDLFSIRKTKL
jgi:hypothetical protein